MTATSAAPASPRGAGHPLRRLAGAWRQPRSPAFVAVALALWLTAAANLTLWRALLRIDGAAAGSVGPVVLAGVGTIVFCATAALLAPIGWSRWPKPLWIAVLLAAAVSQHFMLAYGVVIDTTMLASVGQTDYAETRDLLGWPLLAEVVLVAGLPAAWLLPLPIVAAPWPRRLRQSVVVLATALAAGVIATVMMYRPLAPLVRNHMALRYLPNPLTPIWSAGRLVARSLSPRRPPAASIVAGAALGGSHAAAAATKPPLVVLVVGETARADRFALNGYGRPTTPELAARSVLSFRDAWSCGTSTLASLPCMFSPLGRDRFTAASTAGGNLLDVVQAAGMAVLWVDNQAGCKGVCDRVASASTADLAGSAAAAGLCAGDECLDEALLVGLDERIDRLPAAARAHGVLLVLHMMGSHGPAYPARSPPARKRFLPECATTTLDACDPAALGNAYDNSIAYTDHVLGRTIDWLRGRAAGHATALLYVSDHGESLGEYGVFLHGLPYAIAPDAQKHVPLVLWLSEDIARRDAVDAACLTSRLGRRVSHDNLFHTVLGLVDVRSPSYAPALDLHRACGSRGSG